MRKWPGFPRFVLAVLGVVLLAGLTWILVGPGAAWVLEHSDGVRGLAGKDLAAAVDAVRGRTLAIATGLIALVAVYYAARNADTARRTFLLSEQGHVTDRYTKAIEQLGSDKLDIRLGGIYALERIAHDSARDHPTVMEVLAAFVRENSRYAETNEAGNVLPRHSKLRTDLQAAVTVIGRRTVAQDAPGTRFDFTDTDLSRADLSGANLTRARLINTNLIYTDFSGADLSGVNFTISDLSHANLARANLADADLAGADFTRANLTRANLTRAELTMADLIHANLTNADLTDANLTGAELLSANLTNANLTGANLTGAEFTRADLADAKLTDVVGLPAEWSP